MANTTVHKPFKTTDYAKQDGHNAHQWVKASKHIRRLKVDSGEVHRQNRQRRHNDRNTLRNIQADKDHAEVAQFRSSQRRDAYAWPSF